MEMEIAIQRQESALAMLDSMASIAQLKNVHWIAQKMESVNLELVSVKMDSKVLIVPPKNVLRIAMATENVSMVFVNVRSNSLASLVKWRNVQTIAQVMEYAKTESALAMLDSD